jgi:hypothetical protein
MKWLLQKDSGALRSTGVVSEMMARRQRLHNDIIDAKSANNSVGQTRDDENS